MYRLIERKIDAKKLLFFVFRANLLIKMLVEERFEKRFKEDCQIILKKKILGRVTSKKIKPRSDNKNPITKPLDVELTKKDFKISKDKFWDLKNKEQDTSNLGDENFNDHKINSPNHMICIRFNRGLTNENAQDIDYSTTRAANTRNKSGIREKR